MDRNIEKLMEEVQIILKNSDPIPFALMKQNELLENISRQISILREYTHEEREEKIMPILREYGHHIQTQVVNYLKTGKFPEEQPERRFFGLF